MKTMCLLALFLCVAPMWAQEEPEKPPERRLHFNVAVTASYYGDLRVRNVPEAVRAVPLHRDDSRLSNLPFATRPIVDDDLGEVELQAIGIDFIVVYRWLEIGGRLPYATIPDNRVQQNQLGGTERGIGTSLRFYEFATKNSLSPILTAGVRVPLVKPRGQWGGLRIAAGGEYDPLGTGLEFRAGWDRFDEDERWKTFEVARIHRHGLYARLEIAVAENFGWLCLQVNQQEHRIELKSEFRGLTIQSDDVPIYMMIKFGL